MAISEEQRKRLFTRGRPTKQRVRINNTGAGRWNVKVDGRTIIVGDNHMEASAMKRALQSYLEIIDGDT